MVNQYFSGDVMRHELHSPATFPYANLFPPGRPTGYGVEDKLRERLPPARSQILTAVQLGQLEDLL